MVRGKKGFERIIWAFNNVLNQTVTWLFYDLKGQTDGPGPISAHNPKVRKVEPECQTFEAVEVPRMPQQLQQEDFEAATELLEWLSLATSGSPRIQCDDEIDPYLSRYRVPLVTDSTSDAIERKAQDLVRFSWHGFMPSIFVRNVFLAALKASGPNWFGLNAVAFDRKAYSLLQNDNNTMTWEYVD